MADRLLTVQQAAERLGTSVRFPRRLISERRVAFVHVGRHVRIPESALDDFIASTSTLGRMGEQHEIDTVVVFLASPASSYIAGVTLAVDGGMSGH